MLWIKEECNRQKEREYDRRAYRGGLGGGDVAGVGLREAFKELLVGAGGMRQGMESVGDGGVSGGGLHEGGLGRGGNGDRWGRL